MTFQTQVPSQSIDSNYLKNPINVGQLVSKLCTDSVHLNGIVVLVCAAMRNYLQLSYLYDVREKRFLCPVVVGHLVAKLYLESDIILKIVNFQPLQSNDPENGDSQRN